MITIIVPLAIINKASSLHRQTDLGQYIIYIVNITGTSNDMVISITSLFQRHLGITHKPSNFPRANVLSYWGHKGH